MQYYIKQSLTLKWFCFLVVVALAHCSYGIKSGKLLDLLPRQRHKVIFAVVEFNCRNSIWSLCLYPFKFCTKYLSCFQLNNCKLWTRYIVSRMLKCFSFWGTSVLKSPYFRPRAQIYHIQHWSTPNFFKVYVWHSEFVRKMSRKLWGDFYAILERIQFGTRSHTTVD